MIDYSDILFEIKDDIGILSINRPKAYNALTVSLLDQLLKALDDVEKEDVRVLIITGKGKAFVAGADINEFANLDNYEAFDLSKLGKQAFNKIANLKIPVIAAINGFALGGGLEMALACDIRVAHKNAKLGLPEVSLGLIPGYDGVKRLSRLIGQGNANLMMMTGEAVDAHRALQLGIVQDVTEDDVLEFAIALAKKISNKSPRAVSVLKELVNKGLVLGSEEFSDCESEKFGSLFCASEKQREEGINAFIEKRKANWNK